MFCSKCGSQIPDGMAFCPNCGNRMNKGMGTAVKTPGNLFSMISFDFNPGIKMELVLWIFCCISAVLCFITIIMMGDADILLYKISSIRTVWIFMLLFNIGAGVFIALRFRGINIMYSNVSFFFIMLIAYYLKEKYLFGIIDDNAGSNIETSVNIFFALAVIVALAAIVCIMLDIFTNIKLKFVIMILTIVTICLVFLMVFIPYLLLGGTGYSVSDFGELHFILGSVSYIFICAVTAVYTVLYCKGIIDNNEKMFAMFNTTQRIQKNTYMQGQNVNVMQTLPMIQCIKGSCQNQAFNIQGEIIIGSQMGSANIVLNDTYVSRQHCVVRFNNATGYYEVMDLSSNGVFLLNGARLQKGVYTSCPRGTVLFIGSTNQQFKLL